MGNEGRQYPEVQDFLADMPPETEVLLVAGSPNDAEYLPPAQKVLDGYGIYNYAVFCSVHRTPEEADLLAQTIENTPNNLKRVIAFAGMTAQLGAVLQSKITTEVVAVPIKKPGDGDEAESASLRVPPPIGIGTFNHNEMGAISAAEATACALSAGDPGLKARIWDTRNSKRVQVIDENRILRENDGKVKAYLDAKKAAK